MRIFPTIATMLCCGASTHATDDADSMIVLKKVPKFGAPNATISGRVSGVAPADYKVAAFIGLDQAFYSKPTYVKPNTALSKNGGFTCDITTGPNDPFAQKVVAFVVPKTFAIQPAMGLAQFPQDLLAIAKAHIEVDRYARTVSFSKNKLNVNSGLATLGPGQNYFSASKANVFIDSSKALHLAIVKDTQGKWQCAEVVSEKPVGYGTYRFTVAGASIQSLNENAVFGLFTYDDTIDADPANHSELDFEFSRWGNSSDVNNAQFVVQPFNLSGHLTRFLADQSGDIDLEMTWTPTEVDFTASSGAQVLMKWSYTGSDIPTPGKARLHLNLWLFNGAAPSDGKKQEVIVRELKYAPIK